MARISDTPEFKGMTWVILVLDNSRSRDRGEPSGPLWTTPVCSVCRQLWPSYSYPDACKSFKLHSLQTTGNTMTFCLRSLTTTRQQQQNKQLNSKIGKGFKHSFKEDIQMANNVNRCSTSLVIREMLIKIIMRYHFTSIRIKILPKK